MIKNVAVALLISSTYAIREPKPKAALTAPSTPWSEGQVVKRAWNRSGNNLAQSDPAGKPKLMTPSTPWSEGQVVKRAWNRSGNNLA